MQLTDEILEDTSFIIVKYCSYEQDYGASRREREQCKYKHGLSRSRDNFDMGKLSNIVRSKNRFKYNI